MPDVPNRHPRPEDPLMKKFLPPLCVLTIALLAGADDKPKADAIKAKLKGTWKAVEIVIDGKKLPANEVGEVMVTFDGDKVTIKGKDEPQVGSYTVDASQKPVHLDVVPSDGPDKGKALKFIVEVDGDTLKYAVGGQGRDRPKGFGDKGVAVVTLKREKK
jgi:uncharacterized protein (TIGR03067 family)